MSFVERPTAVAAGRPTAHPEPGLIIYEYRSLAGGVLYGAGVCLPPAPSIYDNLTEKSLKFSYESILSVIALSNNLFKIMTEK